MTTPATSWQFLKAVYQETQDDNILNGAAVLGFYLMLAIFPAMIFVLAVIPYLPIENVDQAIMNLLRQTMPSSASEMFTGAVQEVTQEQRGDLLSFGLLAALWAISNGMYAIMQQLNITYGVKEGRGFLQARLVAISLSLLFVVLVVGGFSLIVLGGQIQAWLGARFDIGGALLAFFTVFRWLVILGALLLAFSFIYYLAPNVQNKFTFITAGSVVGVALLLVASLAFAWYTQSIGNYAATYGSVGAVMVLMLWLFTAGLAILFGSEINVLIERRAGGKQNAGQAIDQRKDNAAAR